MPHAKAFSNMPRAKAFGNNHPLASLAVHCSFTGYDLLASFIALINSYITSLFIYIFNLFMYFTEICHGI